MTLEQMKNIDIKTISPDAVVDSAEIKIDINLPVPERMRDFVKQSGNPYFMKVGKIIVKSSFSNTDTTVNDCLERYLKNC
jgi:hypothetical protein